ncbi:MAG TPA: iron-containing alcohol dehydrogenase [Gemmataceae bacterium]|nr:iron-containing alcohol dehydrogenase [Gemmataceae bacterium]
MIVSPITTNESRELQSPFDYQPLGRVVFGPGALSRLGELARDLGGTRVLLVTDPGLETAGHPQRAVEALRSAGLAVAVFDEVEENPTGRHVEAAAAMARGHRADLLVAVGGGSAMDVAKGTNFVVSNGGSIADYRGFGKATKPMLPSIGVPTTAGTGSEAQSYALIADESSHLKMACGDKKAAFRIAVLDPEVTLTQPKMVTAVTGIDSVAHAIESYVCTKRNALSQTFSRQAWNLLSRNFERVLNQPEDLPARADMQLGAHLGGMAIEASMLGCAHACANPLTAHYGTTHGVAVGVMLPHVIRYNAAAADPLYAELAKDAGLPGGADALARRVTALLRAAELPTTLGECGVSSDIVPVLAVEASEQWTARFNPRPVTEADLRRLYEAAM